jgi:uncharacterized protein
MLYNVAQLLKAPVGTDLRQPVEGELTALRDDDVLIAGPVEGQVRFQRTNYGVLATGEVQVTVELECVRCLKSFDQALTVPFKTMYHPTIEVVSGRPLPPVDDEEGFTIDDRHHLDLSEMLRQEIILALPPMPVCKPDCAGICPICGNDRNLRPCTCEADEDRRLDALSRLTLEFPDEEEE